jgi:hypothetical protein
VAAILGAAWVPAADARGYATLWTAVVVAVSALFVGGYVTLSRPARDDAGKRRWVGEWYWLWVFPALILLVYANSLVFRLIIPAPTSPTVEQVLSQRVSAGISASVFFLLLWLTVMWARRQVETRRAR